MFRNASALAISLAAFGGIALAHAASNNATTRQLNPGFNLSAAPLSEPTHQLVLDNPNCKISVIYHFETESALPAPFWRAHFPPDDLQDKHNFGPAHLRDLVTERAYWVFAEAACDLTFTPEEAPVG